jgi:hypothetical protein
VREPEAIEALGRMGTYLRTLKSFAVTARTTRDDVAESGETVEYASELSISAQLPDRLRVDVASDRSQRQFFYDGDTLVIYAPVVGAYARVDAAPTVRQTLEAANAEYDMDLPLADLFSWGSDDDDSDLIVDAFSVGPSVIGGEDCIHYVYRQADVDWQLWVRAGEEPLPCRLVITTTSEESRPRFTATLDWDLSATPRDEDFTFMPPEGSYEIAVERPGADQTEPAEDEQ